MRTELINNEVHLIMNVDDLYSMIDYWNEYYIKVHKDDIDRQTAINLILELFNSDFMDETINEALYSACTMYNYERNEQ